MGFWNKEKERANDVRYAKVFWVVAIVVICIVVFVI